MRAKEEATRNLCAVGAQQLAEKIAADQAKADQARMSAPGNIPRHWQGTSRPEDCAAALSLERNTASYYDACVAPGQQASKPPPVGRNVDVPGAPLSDLFPPTPTGGTTPPPPDPAFDPKVADPYRFGPRPPQAQLGQTCVPYFKNMLDNFRRNAALCLRDSNLLPSLTDMLSYDPSIESGPSVVDRFPQVTRNSVPELFAIFDPLDPRWTISGNVATPNCNLPMTVASQNDAYLECARVYLCGAKAASCGMQQAQRSGGNECLPISRTCLAANPVPQQMTANPSPRAYEPGTQPPPLPNQPRSNSTITGPSGPGGGTSGSGVRSAQ